MRSRQAVGAVASCSQGWCAPLVTPTRRAGQTASPDRTYNETIQDAQNRFRWHDKHIFRPHQHFTYDPSSWSRPLAEGEKAQRKLSLVQRLAMEEERAKDAAAHRDSIAHLELASLAAMGVDDMDLDAHVEAVGSSGAVAPAPATSGTAVDGDSDIAAGVWAAVPLQELLEEGQRLQRLLTMPRHASGAALPIRARQARERDVVLVQLFRRIQHARVDETATRDALVYAWFVLLTHVGDFLTALTRPGLLSPSGLDEGDAIHTAFTALNSTLLPHLRAETYVGDSLEEWVEAMEILLHPFTQQCFSAGGGAPEALNAAATRLAAPLRDALCERLIEPAQVQGDDEGRGQHSRQAEVLDPLHTRAVAKALRQLRRIDGAGGDVVQPLTALVLRAASRNIEYMTALLRVATAPSGRHEVRAMLSKRRRHVTGPRGGGSSADPVEGHDADPPANPKPVALEETAPSRGIAQPQTEVDDVCLLTASCGDILDACCQGEEGDRARALLEQSLRLLSHTPNYDLDPATSVRFALAVCRSGLLSGGVAEDAAEEARARGKGAAAARARASSSSRPEDAPLAFMLLLSRLDYSQTPRREDLPRLLVSLCRVDPPALEPSAAMEWRRLRGVAVRRLFDTLKEEELFLVAGDGAGSRPVPWVEDLAFGHYDGLVPLPLWREACARWYGSASTLGGTDRWLSGATPDARIAEALLVLRGRFTLQPRQSRQAPVDAPTVEYLARCVETVSAGQLSAGDLLQEPSQWDVAPLFLTPATAPDRDGVPLLFAEARDYVMKTKAGRSKVMSF